jgi:hypothetical protein
MFLRTRYSAPSMSRMKRFTVGLPTAKRRLYRGKHWI